MFVVCNVMRICHFVMWRRKVFVKSVTSFEQFELYWNIFPPARTGPPVAKDHIFLLLPLFSPGHLYWIGSNKSCSMLYSHWSTQTGCNKHARVPATKKTVLCTLITIHKPTLGIGEEYQEHFILYYDTQCCNKLRGETLNILTCWIFKNKELVCLAGLSSRDQW